MEFFFQSTAPLMLGGGALKFQQNMDAIEILKACQADDRPATPEEQAALALYVGWGDAGLLKKLAADPDGLSENELTPRPAHSTPTTPHCR